MTDRYPTEQHLWDAFRQGDGVAFERMYRQFNPVLINYGLKITPNRALVMDVVHDLFLYLWDHRATIGPTSSIRFFLYKSLRRSLTKQLIRAGRFNDAEPEDTDLPSSNPPDHALLRGETEEERARHLAQRMAELPDRQREALFLRFYEGLEFEQVADVMAIQTRAVYKLLYRAFDTLRTHLDPDLLLMGVPALLTGLGTLLALLYFFSYPDGAFWVCASFSDQQPH
jgi:RNA polymerase sigma factor (sigma-70 family)